MCDVPSLAVFFRESIECFPGIASKFFLKLLVTIPVAPIITGIIIIIIIVVVVVVVVESKLSNTLHLFPSCYCEVWCLSHVAGKQSRCWRARHLIDWHGVMPQKALFPIILFKFLFCFLPTYLFWVETSSYHVLCLWNPNCGETSHCIGQVRVHRAAGCKRRRWTAEWNENEKSQIYHVLSMNFEFHSVGVPCYLQLKYRQGCSSIVNWRSDMWYIHFLHHRKHTIQPLQIRDPIFLNRKIRGAVVAEGRGVCKMSGVWRNEKIGVIN